MRAESHRLRAKAFGQHHTVHVVRERRRGALREVVLRRFASQNFLELLPGHALGDGIDNTETVIRPQHGRVLRQRALWPDHLLSAPTADTVLRADPDSAIRGWRIHE